MKKYELIYRSDLGDIYDAIERESRDEYQEYYRVEDADAKISELKRRLDAVLAMLEPGKKPKGNELLSDVANAAIAGIHMFKQDAHARAAAIAKGEES